MISWNKASANFQPRSHHYFGGFKLEYYGDLLIIYFFLENLMCRFCYIWQIRLLIKCNGTVTLHWTYSWHHKIIVYTM